MEGSETTPGQSTALPIRQENHRQLSLVAVVGNLEPDREILSSALEADDTLEVVVSISINEAEAALASRTIHLILGVVNTEEECDRFRELADRFHEVLSVVFASDPAALRQAPAVNEVADRPGEGNSAAFLAALRAMLARHRRAGISRAEAMEHDAECLHLLSDRERQVLALTAEGKSIKEIARALHRAYGTVASHRDSIRRKIHLHDIAALTRFAIRTGLIRA